MFFQEIHNEMIRFGRRFLSALRKHNFFFPKVLNDLAQKTFYFNPTVSLPCNLAISFFSVFSLKALLRLKFSYLSSLRSRCIVAHKILDVLELWEKICIQETIFCCEEGSPMLEGDEEFLIHLVGKKQMDGLQQFWNHPWNLKLGENVFFFNGTLSQTLANNFYLKEYIELSANGHRLLLPPSKKSVLFFAFKSGSRGSTDNHYHPLLCRLDFIIQYALFRRMILIQEYRFYQSLLSSEFPSSTNPYSTGPVNGCNNEKEERREVLLCDNLREKDHASSNTRWPLWLRSLSKRNPKEEKNNKKMDALRRERDLHRMKCRTGTEAWRICGTPSWLLSRERHTQQDRTVRHRFFCLPLSYFPVESVMPHLADWLYDDVLEKMLPLWKRVAQTCLIKYSHACCSQLELWKEEEKEEKGEEWMRKRGPGGRRSRRVQMLYQGQGLAAHSAVYFWFYRYTSALLEKQLQSAEMNANRFYQDRVYDGSFRFFSSFFHFPKHIGRGEGQRCGTPQDAEENTPMREEEAAILSPTPNLPQPQQKCMDPHSSFSSLPSSPFAFSSMPMMKGRPSMVRKLLFLEGFTTCVITCLDLFSSRVFADVSILSAAMAMTGEFPFTKGEGNVYRREEAEGNGSRWRGRCADAEWKDEGDVLFSFSTKVLWSLLSSVGGVLLRGVRREITKQLSDVLSEDLEDHIASVLIAADHAFLDRLFTFEGGGSDGRPRGVVTSSSFSSGPRSSPYRFHGRGLYTPSAKGVIRRVGGAGEVLVTQWDDAIRRWATGVVLLSHAFYWRDGSSLGLAFGWAWGHHKNIVGKIAVGGGFAQDTSSWIWLREQSPPFHRTPFGLSLLLDVLSEMEGEASTTTPLLDGCSFPDKVEAATTTTSERMSDAHGTHTTRRTAKMHRRPHILFLALSFLVCSDVWHIPVCFLAPALSSLPREGRGQEGPEEEDDEKKKKKTQEAANDTMHASRDLFATHPAEDHRPILLPWSRGQRWLRFYTLLASPFTIPCATEQEPWWTGAMTASLLAMQEMVACIKEEVIRPAVPHRRSVPHGQNANGRWDVTEAGRGVDITEEGTMTHSSTGGTTTFPSWSPAPRVPPLVSSSATAFLLHGRQEHVYELDPEEQAMVRHPGVLENLPYAGSGALWRHFQPHSFFLLKQLGLESVMTFKAWTEKVREEAANDSFDDSGDIRGSPPDHSPTAGSSLSSWWRWWWGRLGSHTEALFAHDGTSNPFAALLRQCVEVVEVVLLAGCTCIRVRWRRRPPPSFATFAFSSGAEEDEREGKGEIATTTQGEREAAKPMRGKRGVSFSNALLRGMRMLHTFSPLSRLEWYTECTPHAASLLLMREARWTMYQRAIASALRQKSSRRHTRFLSGMYELLHYLPSTMADDSPRGRSAEMTRRRMLWRCYLSSASCPLFLRFNAQHCITGGLVLTQGIRFHDVSFLYPQLRYGMVTCGDPWRSSCASSTPLEAVEMAWETPTGEKTHTVGKKTETAQDGVHGSDGNMPLPGRGTPTTGAPISTADDTPGRTTTHPLRHADPDALEEERCGTIQKEEGTTVYSSSLVTPILSNVTMFFPSSGMSAVIGRTGAGKSTLFHLLSRVYDPTPEVWVEWKVHTSTTPMQQSRKTKETKRDSPLCAGLSGEEEGEEGESHPSHRLPWSRELAADIVFQLFSHTIPLPPSSSSSFSSTPECSHEREDYTVGITRPGYVSFDCIPAACFSLCYLRQWFLPMEQTPTILPHRTFEENIRFTHAAVRSRDVAWAAAACQCMPFIQKTPLQLQQPVHGMLSGGEQQRLGLARVFAASCARMRAYRLSHAYYHWGATVPWPSTGRPASSSLSSHPSFSSSHGALEGCPSRPKEEEEEEEASGRGNILVDASWSSLSSPTNSPSTLLVPAAENHTEVHQIKEACGAVASSAAVVPSFSTSPSALCPSSPPSLQHTVAVAGVLLDEPTSRLDAVHERKVEEAIRSLCLMPSSSSSSSTSSSFSFSSPVGRRWSARQLMAGGKLLPSPAPTCMVIVIAHRLSTIQAASHIIVLEDGKVEAEGTPQNVFRTSSFARKQLLLQRVLPDRP